MYTYESIENVYVWAIHSGPKFPVNHLKYTNVYYFNYNNSTIVLICIIVFFSTQIYNIVRLVRGMKGNLADNVISKK